VVFPTPPFGEMKAIVGIALSVPPARTASG
jgi:hypothetical protein